MTDTVTPASIIDFWFSPGMEARWFNSTPALDAEIRERYQSLWESAATGGLDEWRASAQGALALAIVLDQFPLNMFRGTPAAFSTEQRAVAVAKQAVATGYDKQIPGSRRAFLYMPLMHSESMPDQDLSVELFESAGLDENAKFARHHRGIVERFGRFPHRNAILGRESTEEELAYLRSPQAFTG